MDGNVPEVSVDDVVGCVLVTQTCDIANDAPGKEYVTICPLVRIAPQNLEYIRTGRTPGAALLENPPEPDVVVDLGRMTSLHKSILNDMPRVQGFSTDAGRMKFAQALERKFGRFAFPDAFNDRILAKIRERILSAHSKENSDKGKAYRSIKTARVAALPGWEATGKKEVVFYFVLEHEGIREASKLEISEVLKDHMDKLVWPDGFSPASPPYFIYTTDEMTASEWLASQPIDWDFISYAGRVVG